MKNEVLILHFCVNLPQFMLFLQDGTIYRMLYYMNPGHSQNNLSCHTFTIIPIRFLPLSNFIWVIMRTFIFFCYNFTNRTAFPYFLCLIVERLKVNLSLTSCIYAKRAALCYTLIIVLVFSFIKFCTILDYYTKTRWEYPPNVWPKAKSVNTKNTDMIFSTPYSVGTLYVFIYHDMLTATHWCCVVPLSKRSRRWRNQ